MSVILDALKKLDREKSSRRTGTPNIAAEILRPDLPRPGKKVLLYLAAVSIATAAITYVVMVEFGFLSRSSPPAAVSPLAPTRQVIPAFKESGSLAKSLPPEAGTAPAPSQFSEAVRDARDEISRVPSKIQDDAEKKISATPPGEKKTDQNVISREEVVAPQTRKVPEYSPGRSATTPPSLRISGIVWTEEPSKRIAVINGASFTEGSEIEGVKILEIHPTRVRFLHNDRPFEIPLGSSIVIK